MLITSSEKRDIKLLFRLDFKFSLLTTVSPVSRKVPSILLVGTLGYLWNEKNGKTKEKILI